MEHFIKLDSVVHRHCILVCSTRIYHMFLQREKNTEKTKSDGINRLRKGQHVLQVTRIMMKNLAGPKSET